MGWTIFASVLLAVAGCDKGAPSSGSGSGSGMLASTCVLDGSYQLRFHTNGADGWWLDLKITGRDAVITGGASAMLGLVKGPVAMTADLKACSLTIAQKNHQAGELAITITPDRATGIVKGSITRTLNDDSNSKVATTTPLTGLRETAAPTLPSCLKPGVFELRVDGKPTWKLTQGRPRFGLGCHDDLGPFPSNVLVTVLGPEIFVDEYGEQGQSFSRGVVTRDGDCAITLAYARQDFEFTGAKLVFDGDKITGTADAATFAFMEDGEAGENLWKCSSTRVKLVGTRIGD